MKERKLENWISSYMEYMENTESASILHKWTCLSVLAGALRKKVNLSLGRLNIYTNMYVILVGPPGAPRKSQAISYGVNFLREIPDLVISADAITPQALIQDLEASAVDEPLPEGKKLQHASLTVISKELESFLGQKGENTKMIVTLTDLFDAQEIPWKYRTKHYGTNTIPSVFLNILAATTPESIVSSIPLNAVGGGLTSRIVFVWAERKEKKITRPIETSEELKLKDFLMQDLYVISRLAGSYNFTKDSYEFWDNWYQNYDSQSRKRKCVDPLFNGWYERKPLYVQKLAIIIAASQGNELVLKTNHFLEALKILEDTEIPMINVFKSMGRSVIATDVDLVSKIIQSRKWVLEEQLVDLTWRDIDSAKLDNVIATVIRRGFAKRSYLGPKGEKGKLWYKYTGPDY